MAEKQRNRRATITDHALAANADVPSYVSKRWEEIVKRLQSDGVKIGTEFVGVGDNAPSHYADLLAYGLPTVLKLAQSRQHNKLMDSYADPIEAPDPIHEVRSVDAELVKGTWSQRGEGGPRFMLLDRAVAAVYGVTNEVAKARIEKLVADGKTTEKDLRADATFKAKMAEIKLADAQARADAAKAKAPTAPTMNLFADETEGEQEEEQAAE